MDKAELAKLCEARDTLCNFCEADECDKCIVTRLINDAYNELPDGDTDDETPMQNEPVIHITLVSYRQECPFLMEEWSDDYYLPVSEVSASAGNTLEEKCLCALKNRVFAFSRTATGFCEIIESSYDFNWGDLAIGEFGCQDRTGQISESVTISARRDEILIPNDPVLVCCTVGNPAHERKCLLDMNTGDFLDDDEPEDGPCTIQFADGSTLDGKICNGRFQMKQ